MFRWLKPLVFVVLALMQSAMYSQCAMCKAALESSDNDGGFNDAILYLMMFPYIIALGAIVLFVFLLNKKKVQD